MINVSETQSSAIACKLNSTPGINLVTWINHSSLLRLRDRMTLLQEFYMVGIDGIFLRNIMRVPHIRTSADLVIPKILAGRQLKVFLIGGEKNGLWRRSERFRELFPQAKVVLNISGFEENILEKSITAFEICKPNVIVLGLGAVKQEELAVNILQRISQNENCLILTCGGWLDQIVYDQYYPSWAYSLRLNWLVRLIREPRRLWRRYSIDAVRILLKRDLVRRARQLPNLM